MRGRVTLGLKGHGRGRSCSSQPSAGAAPGGAVGQPESECAGCPPANEDTVGSGEEGGAAVVRMTLSQMRVAKIKAERAKMAAQKVAAARRRREEAADSLTAQDLSQAAEVAAPSSSHPAPRERDRRS